METYPDSPISSGRYPRLRPGPGLNREVVAAHQQSRLQRAMIEIVATHGYEAVTVRGLAKRARISTGTFYKHYRSTDDCLLCTFDHVCERTSHRLVEAGRHQLEPRRRLALAIERLFRDMVAAPQAAKFMVRAAPTVGPAFTSELRTSAMQLGTALELCIDSDGSPPLDPLLLEGMVAGLARIGHLLPLAAGEEEIKAATDEAVAWVMSLCAPLPQDAEPPPASAPRQPHRWEEGVLGDERAMILAAAFRIARSGYDQLSVPRICREAGVSRREFKNQFESLEDCFVSAVEERVAAAIQASVRRRDPSAAWGSAIRDALRTLCDAIEGDRDSARVLFVEITAAGTQGIDSRDQLISQLASAQRTTAPAGESPSELAAEASTAAAWAIVRRRVQDQDSTLTDALTVLAHLTLAPTTSGVGKHTVGVEKHTEPIGKPILPSLDIP